MKPDLSVPKRSAIFSVGSTWVPVDVHGFDEFLGEGDVLGAGEIPEDGEAEEVLEPAEEEVFGVVRCARDGAVPEGDEKVRAKGPDAVGVRSRVIGDPCGFTDLLRREACQGLPGLSLAVDGLYGYKLHK
jgi:hypothetical protein